MSGFGAGRPKPMMMHESISAPLNHRDASNTSARPWRNPPTPISVPGADDRLQRTRHPQHNMRIRATNFSPSNHSADESQQPRRHDNPYSRMSNTLSRRPGNPNVRQTLLGVPPDDHFADSHTRKRQKLDISIPSLTANGASSSYIRNTAPRSTITDPDIQVIEPFRSTKRRSNPIPNDAEIIEVGTASDDLGERVPRTTSSSSPDPILLIGEEPHAFQTLPTNRNSSNKGKARAKAPPEYVEGSEEEEEITEFTPPCPSPVNRSSNTKEIPMNIVHQRRKAFEDPTASAPAAIRHPIGKGVPVVDFTTTIIGKMKKKDEGISADQRGTEFDRVGTSSSNFTNSARGKEKIQILPLMAWCLGHHLFTHSEAAPLTLAYELSLQRIKVTLGRSPPEKIEFKVDRDVCSATIVNESEEPLKQDVVVQFMTTSGSTWKEAERKYKGFKAGGGRGDGMLTFLLSTTKDRCLPVTAYQRFVTGVRKAFRASDVQIIKPSVGASHWEFARNLASMFELTESTNGKETLSEHIPDEPSARSITPCSSTSAKTGPKLETTNGDPGSSTSYRRSARQSAIRSLRASPPLPPQAKLEPDEVVLMYSPSGTGALNIMLSDLRRLQPEEYLNDTLIEFGLKLWLEDLREKDPTLADQIHVFSSFFYKKLNNKKNPEDGYQSVRKWTSKVHLFTKKYVIVPINENIHWYLAIIYEPGHMLQPPLLSSQHSTKRTTRKQAQRQELAKAHSERPMEISTPHATEERPEVDTSSSMNATRATTPCTVETEEMDDAAITIFDRSCSITAACPTFSETQIRDSSPQLLHPSDSMDVDVDPPVMDVAPNSTREVLEPSTSKLSSVVPVSQFYGFVQKPGVHPVVIEDNEDSGEDQRQEAEVDDMLAETPSSTVDLPPQTYIFTLDSLGTRHPQAIKVLKQYLKSEAKDKCKSDEVREAVGKQVQVPVQPNTWDCGIYLLHLVRVFMSSPSEFVEQILSTRGTMPSPERKKMWQDHEVAQFRDHLHARIIHLSEKWKAEKTVREEGVTKRNSGDALEVEALSSEGEVDIVEDLPSVKATPGPKQKQPAKRLRG